MARRQCEKLSCLKAELERHKRYFEARDTLEPEIRREPGVIDAAMLADTRRPCTAADHGVARESMTQFAARRVRYVECDVARLTAAKPCSQPVKTVRTRLTSVGVFRQSPKDSH